MFISTRSAQEKKKERWRERLVSRGWRTIGEKWKGLNGGKRVYFLLAGVRMFKIGGAVVVHLAGIGLLDVARSSFGPSHVPPFLEDVLEGVPELVAKPEQEYRLVPAENRQLQLPEQVSQPFGGQAEKVVEEGWGHDGGSEKFVVKRSGGFGPATDSRLETDRDKAHLRTRYRVRDHLRGGCTILPWSIVLGMVEHARGERETRRQYNTITSSWQQRDRIGSK